MAVGATHASIPPTEARTINPSSRRVAVSIRPCAAVDAADAAAITGDNSRRSPSRLTVAVSLADCCTLFSARRFLFAWWVRPAFGLKYARGRRARRCRLGDPAWRSSTPTVTEVEAAQPSR
jgi:hypothetical protein